MDNIVRIEEVFQYNELMGIKNMHPLVSVIDFSNVKPVQHLKKYLGLYVIYLKDTKCGDIRYGRNIYDYKEGTLVFTAPGQIMDIDGQGEFIQPMGWALVFHPNLIHGTSLGRNIKNYNFFSYEVYEALHISEQERQIVIDCFNKIEIELRHAIDKHSQTLVVANIELLLSYCVRFYDRQFIMRSKLNNDILSKFENLLDSYFGSDKPLTLGLPTVKYCADQLFLSPNYFGDLIKKETGKSAQEHIQLKLVDLAKERIFDMSKSVSEIAYELGFKHPQNFTRMFKSEIGLTPNEYRSLN
jgi:AraC-like DNA-binding protein